MSSPNNTVYVVTGANSGLGLGLVKSLLARPSTTVIGTVRNAAAAASLEKEFAAAASALSVSGSSSALHIVQLDFTTAPEPHQVRDAVVAAAGPSLDHVDVLICNAGLCPPLVSAAATGAADMRTAFETNAIAPLMVFQGLWPLLQKRSSSSSSSSSSTSAPKLIMVSSSVGSIGQQEPLPGGAYGASKAALNWVTRSLHLQHEADGLVAVALHPGWVQTRNGDFAAREWGYAAGPPETVENSVRGMLEVIDGASRDTVSGKFVTYTGEILSW
ncbi:hypothetical protein BX600DRAFT_434934 [Xylariales sp. PMI_506]|nr:hypothetical protein BX600DRAFT_434934 [Xylariales sp. PMI_506]